MSDEPIEITAIPCPNCGHAIPIGQTYCEGCGIGDPSSKKNPPISVQYQAPKPEEPAGSIPPQMSIPPDNGPTHRCPNCGHSIPNGTSYCANCGMGSRPSYGPVVGSKQKTPTWVWVLIFVLGLPLLCCGGCFLMTALSSVGGNYQPPAPSR